MSGPISLPPVAQPAVSSDIAAGGNGTRVDDAHRQRLGRKGNQRSRPASAVAADPATAHPWRAPREPSSPEDLLRLHAADLIVQLQQSAESLDAREARLNAQIALHERREREFRLWSESQRSEMEELREEAERLQAELKNAARRIALTNKV